MQKLNIDLICVGKIKQKPLTQLIDDFSLRISKYAKLNVIELKDISGDNIEIIKDKEAELMLPYLNESNYIIACCIDGKSFSSEAFAKHLNDVSMQAKRITFVIGGSHGLSDKIISKANLKLSFSNFTFPHQLFRLMLLEQIYRALNILNNTPYHK